MNISTNTDAPQVTAFNSSSPRIVLREELRLQCNYAGVPAPSIQWFHNGVLLRNGVDGVSINTGDNSSSILIAVADHSDGGTCTCRANNSLGTNQESYSVVILRELKLYSKLMYHDIMRPYWFLMSTLHGYKLSVYKN